MAADGPWDSTDTAVCIPVLIVLWIYTFIIPARRPEQGTAERFAVATVFGFIVSIGLAWPSQAAFNLSTATAYYPAAALGCVTGLIIWLWYPGANPKTGVDSSSHDKKPIET